MTHWLKWTVTASAATLLLSGCGGGDHEAELTPASNPGNLAQVADQQGFTALTAAVSKAGLGTALSDGNARLTVFAPTNAAFNNLAVRLGFRDAGALVEALPAPVLAEILSYHLLPMRKSASELAADGPSQSTLYRFEGSESRIALDTRNGLVLTDGVLNKITVTTADVQASNGVIHAVDKVLVPPGVLNVVQMARANPLFDSLAAALTQANLQTTLSAPGPYTVFAPTNTAFSNIRTTVDGLSPSQLRTVLTYHVLPSRVLAAQISFAQPVATVSGQTITFNAGTPPTITDTTISRASLVATDVRASNGVIHVVDKVLIPLL